MGLEPGTHNLGPTVWTSDLRGITSPVYGQHKQKKKRFMVHSKPSVSQRVVQMGHVSYPLGSSCVDAYYVITFNMHVPSERQKNCTENFHCFVF